MWKRERQKEWPQRTPPEVLLRAESGFFSATVRLRAFFSEMVLSADGISCSSETFLCCLEGRENASLLVDLSSAAVAFSCAALLLHQNNEKVAKAESDCQGASAACDSGWRDGVSMYLGCNNTKLSQKHCRRLARDRCQRDKIILLSSSLSRNSQHEWRVLAQLSLSMKTHLCKKNRNKHYNSLGAVLKMCALQL